MMKYFCLLFLFVTQGVSAALYIVVNETSDVNALQIEDVSDLYLGRKKLLGDTYIDQVLDREGKKRQRFFLRVANMKESQVNAYWARLKFSGRMRAPEGVGSDEDLYGKLLENPKAIGYVTSQPPQDSGIRVALKIDE